MVEKSNSFSNISKDDKNISSVCNNKDIKLYELKEIYPKCWEIIKVPSDLKDLIYKCSQYDLEKIKECREFLFDYQQYSILDNHFEISEEDINIRESIKNVIGTIVNTAHMTEYTSLYNQLLNAPLQDTLSCIVSFKDMMNNVDYEIIRQNYIRSISTDILEYKKSVEYISYINYVELQTVYKLINSVWMRSDMDEDCSLNELFGNITKSVISKLDNTLCTIDRIINKFEISFDIPEHSEIIISGWSERLAVAYIVTYMDAIKPIVLKFLEFHDAFGKYLEIGNGGDELE